MFKTLFIFFLIPTSLIAQSTITGEVWNMANKKALPDASVFLSNASVGSKTIDDGSFTLQNVKNGQYDLVVSCIGYETYHQNILVNSADVALPAIELMPKVTVLKEVKVRFDPDREKHIQQFLAEFFGHTDNATACKLLNPEILDVTYEKSTAKLTAESSDFLIIENVALGYRIKYLLDTFLSDPRAGFLFYAGSSTFEPMKGTKAQEKKWARKRTEAYLGSKMHFLRSCIGNRVTDEGFTVRRLIRRPNNERPPDSLLTAKIKFFDSTSLNTPYTDSLRYWSAKARLPKYMDELVNTHLNCLDFIKLTEKKGIYAFGYTDCLMIDYKNSHSSVVTFKEPYAFFDNNGIVLNPHSDQLEGFWGTQRIAELLPVDYEVPVK